VPGDVGMPAGVAGYDHEVGVRQKYAGMEGDDATGMSHTLWREYDLPLSYHVRGFDAFESASFKCGRIRLLISGAYRWTHLQTVEWSADDPRSLIISSRSR
jgi:hypothetical protein